MSVQHRDQVEHFTGPGGIIYSPASAHSREMAKWETQPKSDGSVTKDMIDAARRAGVHMGPDGFKEFPKVMYRFAQTPNGIKPDEHLTVTSLVEQRNLESRGFHASQDDAIQAVHDANFDAAEAAANRAVHDRRMSESAQREAEAIDLSVARHLGEIPAAPLPPKRERVTLTDVTEPPVAKRGRKSPDADPVGA